MNLDLTETQSLLRDNLRAFLEKEVPFARIRELEKRRETDLALWRALIAQGWLGAPFPQAVGGADGGLVEAGLVIEEIQRRAAIVPAMEALAAALTVFRHGAGARASAFAASVLAGELVPVPALLERGDRFGEIAASADGAGRLRGEKWFVDYAEFATHHLVAALGPDGEPGLWLVERSDPAVKLEATHSLARTPQSIARYDGARAERLASRDGLEALVLIGRALAAVQIVACMQVALEQTVAYVRVREQFGRPIGTFMAVQHHAANMAMALESARFLAYEALDRLTRGEATPRAVAFAKAAASRSVPEVTMLAHQLHGGHGFIEENDLYFFTLRGKERSLAWGTADECLELVAQTLETPEDWL